MENKLNIAEILKDAPRGKVFPPLTEPYFVSQLDIRPRTRTLFND